MDETNGKKSNDNKLKNFMRINKVFELDLNRYLSHCIFRLKEKQIGIK